MSDPDISLLMYSPLSLRMGAGGDRWLAEVAPRLKKRGINPSVAATDFIARGYRRSATNWYVDKLLNAGIEYNETKSWRFFHGANLPVLTPESLRQLSRRMAGSDVTYFMNAYALQDVTIQIAKFLANDSKVISAQHASIFQHSKMHNLYIRLITRNTLHAFNAYHVLNEDDYLQYRRWGLDRVFMVPDGVDTKRFVATPSKDQSEFRALFVGRLDYQKGVDTLLEAFIHLEQDAPRINVYVCGTGPMREVVERFAEKHDRFHYLGYVPDDELLSQYKSASLFLMPSRREAFGLVGLEAMASGTPIVASNIPGPRSFVKNDFGSLIPPSDAAALAKATRRFYRLFVDDREKWRMMSADARDLCVREYDWERVVDKLSYMIREVAGKRHKL
ncbi:MAG: glycosyltransferase family 4 protein [Candidatus Thorarchaeota archaeon]